MRAVLDANVLFSAFVVRGTCAQVLETVLAHHRLVVSDGVLADVRRHLAAKVRATERELDDFEAVLRATAEIAEPTPLEQPVSGDPDDDAILGLALASGADVVVTGDRDLLVLRAFRGIPIVSPRTFLERFAHADPS